MQATTIKLDGALVRRLKSLKPRDETLTGFVRSILDAEVRKQKMREAAEKYSEFLRLHPSEQADVDQWASAALQRPAKTRRAR